MAKLDTSATGELATGEVETERLEVPALALAFSLPTPAVRTGVRLEVPALPLTFGLPAPAVKTGVRLDVPALALDLGFPAPGVKTGVRLDVPSLALTFGLPLVEIYVLDLVSPDAVYGCQIEPASIAWAFDDAEPATGEVATGEASAISRVYVGTTLNIATEPFGTSASDTPADTWFRGRLASLSFRRSLNNGTDFSGVILGDGELTIDNTDGRYDDLLFQGIAGATVTIKVGKAGSPFKSWFTILSGTARAATFDDDLVHIQIRDDSYRLDVPLQTTLFTGSGGLEGGDAITGKPLPLLLGYGNNVAPVQLDATDLTYMITGGAMDGVFSVRDDGGELTLDTDYATYALLVAATVAPGYCATCLAAGVIRTGSIPVGQLTASAATYRSSGKSYLSAIVRGVLEDIAGLTRFDDATFTALASAYPDDHGWWYSENEAPTIAQAMTDLLGGVLGYVGFRRGGSCFVGVVDVPDADPVANYGIGKMFDLVLDALPSGLTPPSWRRRLNYFRNFTIQTTLVGSADPSWSQPGMTATAADATVKNDFALAQDPPPADTSMVDATAAEAEVLRQLDLVKGKRPWRRATLPRLAITVEIGDIVELAPDRLGGTRRGTNVEDNIEVTADAVDTVRLGVHG